MTPRSAKPHIAAGTKVTIRTACSSVNAPFVRAQWLRRCVWRDESINWETWAPESENVVTMRGCRISTRAAS